MCTLLIVNVKAACPERTTFEPRAYRSSASMPDATTVEPSARQSVPILLHSNRGEAGTDDDGEAVTIARGRRLLREVSISNFFLLIHDSIHAAVQNPSSHTTQPLQSQLTTPVVRDSSNASQY